MPSHLLRDLGHLKRKLLELGAQVEDDTRKAMMALCDRRLELAEEVIATGPRIDQKEVEIEEDCLKILALHQPVAADLRFIIVVLKVNNDLERMGDQAINIAERATYLATHEPLNSPVDLRGMAERVSEMLKTGLDCLVRLDAALAREILVSDDAVDAMQRDIHERLQVVMREDPSTIDRALRLLVASRHLERIADLTTNIAEDVVFMVEGEVVRHRNIAGDSAHWH